MKSALFSLVLGLFLSVPLQADVTKSEDPKKLKVSLSNVASNCIAEVQIYYYPEDEFTHSAIRPEELEERFRTRITLRNFQDLELRKEVLLSLRPATVQLRSGGPADLRWGLVCYDDQGKRIVSIYLDRFGKGQVDNVQVSTDGRFLKLLRSRCICR